jgi:hypothetical protein
MVNFTHKCTISKKIGDIVAFRIRGKGFPFDLESPGKSLSRGLNHPILIKRTVSYDIIADKTTQLSEYTLTLCTVFSALYDFPHDPSSIAHHLPLKPLTSPHFSFNVWMRGGAVR